MEKSIMKTRQNIVQLVIAICGVYAYLWGLWLFNQYLLMDFPLAARMVLLIVMQWPLFLAPGLLMIANKEKLRDIGVVLKPIARQIVIGVLLAAAMSAVFTVLPILLGFRESVGNTSYTRPWQFIYQFFYSILGVALAEELVFRGYLFYKLRQIRDSRWFAIGISSVLFGMLHIFNGNPIQILVTTVIGFIYCLFREYIKGCSLLSLILGHGIYDALIVLWMACL